ncbi:MULTISPECIES: CU044_2847 family protein [Cyanophyceae]|uniref:CU044_2847 family protein n=2 Tax=Cyanobacteriota TaxID=1117 RepID=UPI00232C3A37|nr:MULTISPECIES: CU044_2847 family protein [Cyanophyceae]MDB9357033.1 CU044_2847 family protein [Nodularia spumigena CS-587/03]MDB9318713.1 CU044_2847 family protein [Nodularia spumigena CS-590/01A]MDB9335911.1 CU044_2847 family protein [Nodularia spumigena CS-590/01]MDB9338687.1 CU044_2847 family protein [Nodularia spumigena CS-589/07]MDB9347626.1 CU044_2847 family protein [Nodularia spumigena CS-588/01]
MEKQLVEFSLEDGSTFLVEVEEPDNGAVGRVALPSGRTIAEATKTFEDAIDKIKPAVASITNKFKELSPEEMEIKFGVKLSAEAGAILTSVGGEVNFEITVKWTKN